MAALAKALPPLEKPEKKIVAIQTEIPRMKKCSGLGEYVGFTTGLVADLCKPFEMLAWISNNFSLSGFPEL